jgi:hypothetical protein
MEFYQIDSKSMIKSQALRKSKRNKSKENRGGIT